MKKLTLIIVAFFTAQLLFSQTVLTNSTNFTIGDTYRYDGYEEVTNIEPGPGGSNMTWDFSQVTGLTYIEGAAAICVDPSTTPFADSASVAGANICVRNVDEGVSPYQYYNCKNSSQELLAMGLIGASNSSFSTYTNILTAHEFPFAYGDSFDDTWELFGFNIDLGYYFMRDSSIVAVEADAYGTITTPTGTYQNALRIKRTTTMYAWFKWEEGGEWNPSGPYTDTDYEWYAPNIKVPVMIITHWDGFIDYSVRYLVDYNSTTGIITQQENNIEIFPNPIIDKLSIRSTEQPGSIEIFTIQGQLIHNSSSQLNQQKIDLSMLPKGVYFIKLGFKNNEFITRKIIKQ